MVNSIRIGSYNIEDCITENDKFDRRKFGKVKCGECSQEFNPFYNKTLTVERDWNLRWVGCDHREPYMEYSCRCTKCKTELFFTVYIPQ